MDMIKAREASAHREGPAILERISKPLKPLMEVRVMQAAKIRVASYLGNQGRSWDRVLVKESMRTPIKLMAEMPRITAEKVELVVPNIASNSW